MLAGEECFECGDKKPSWASCTLGIYLCMSCAGIHRGLGVDVSYVRSVTLDNWTERQVELMKIGGNERAREFFGSSPSPSVSAGELVQRYRSARGAEYRLQLEEELESRLGPAKMASAPPRRSEELRGFEKASSISSDQLFGTEAPKQSPLCCPFCVIQ